MPGTDWLRRYVVELGWAAFAAANWASMIAWPSWETIPFHFVWISLTLVYGFRVWSNRVTSVALLVVAVTTGGAILADAFQGIQLWGELFEVPLMSAMFLAMVWHARRRRAAAERVQALLQRQERFLQDVSHELRTPVTIARGHLELLGAHADGPELAVALDELARIERIISRLLLLAKAGQPGFVMASAIDVEPFLDDLFMRWSEIAPRAWRLGPVAPGRLRADEEALRAALDALLENAVKHTDPHDPIELRATALAGDLVIEVADGGAGVSPEALDRIFDRFARADDARTRADGGVGLGLSIVAAIAAAHGGSAAVVPQPSGATFVLQLPGFEPARRPWELAVPPDAAPLLTNG
ncbi:MAG TPA: HAMP domain-containing sensor histidine kinase [Gaiellaceae bacterium]